MLQWQLFKYAEEIGTVKLLTMRTTFFFWPFKEKQPKPTGCQLSFKDVAADSGLVFVRMAEMMGSDPDPLVWDHADQTLMN